MCQLLGMNCATPTDITFSFRGFSQRAGITSDHSDGFGIAFFEDKACRLFVDNQSAVESPIAELVRNYPIKSRNVIAHIRKATQGKINLENSHPFSRELWGRQWIFAHNGDLKDFLPELSGRFTPVGNTDSERAFCYLLDQLVKHFGYDEPKLDQVFDLLAEISPSIAEHGTFNFCLSNGQALFTYATTKLHWLVREYPFKPAQLIDIEVEVDFSQVTTPEDRVAVITTEPLTQNEEWTAFQEGEMILFRDGAKYRSQLTHVARLERERLDPSLKRVTKADLY
ncbi:MULTISPECIES: class II glutamine amidotransferase [Acinetobacter]|uniref:Class II glutamine amidotransferase n=1 Tax=Acinetobacter variabilis TaxID=70346 RepID=A0A7T7WL65_9GAMM|nr:MULTISPECIES: class II glutamine amidotransferase [Acinetobacter]NHB65082.1 class II glutamine amidotransferase [Acinetobacter sp. GFQ9D191M]NHC00939.1 class II glutamine amidotransferase [Acinetobacter sp. GFQ9D192M]QQN89504.1 class II glutamine amidotransferase [Acinetobacter variabilis]UNW08099.1 class II glutamine amidotransferase [Acinetobacter variabilis]WPC36200.1 class II glutamine amidotransferase [Acinetobacter sp. YWS30-1]